MKPLDRRAFLGRGLGALAGSALAPGWLSAAARLRPERGARALVVVELFGGNDGLNTLVPFADERYHALRPLLALPRERCLALDETQGLHPSLARLREWYGRGHVALRRGVGYPEPNLSHFTSRDIWSCARTGSLPSADGWLWGARGADEPGLLALGNDSAPPIARGQAGTALAVRALADFHLGQPGALDGPESAARRAAFEALVAAPRGERECEYTAARLREALRCAERLQGVARSARGAQYPGTRLGSDLASCADVLAADLPTRLFHVQHDGYDTHSRQLETQARLLGELDLALDAFLCDLAAQGRLEHTLVLVVSEFGRRAAESGVGLEAGTDHGAASVALLAGGGVRGGVSGAAPDLGALDAAGNPVHTTDFRSVLREALGGWLGLDAGAILDGDWPTLDLVRNA
jgi:uncharacterized protein (DUF1501 family)